MSDALTIVSPAKINVFLAVHARRPDGYHTITTVFERIDLCDELTIERCEASHGISLQCDHPGVPVNSDNLAVRAAKRLLETVGVTAGVRMILSKRIPVAGGLGGGSSNAAAALRGVSRLLGLKVPQEQLVTIGRSLGADVAFFLYDVPWAVGEGLGDVIRPLPVVRQLWHLLVIPPVAKPSTGAVYGALPPDLTQPNENANLWHFLIKALESGHLDRFANRNDLERSKLIQQEPIINQAKRMLLGEGASWVGMSGAGPSVFGIFAARDEAESAAQRVRQRVQWPVFVVKTF